MRRTVRWNGRGLPSPQGAGRGRRSDLLVLYWAGKSAPGLRLALRALRGEAGFSFGSSGHFALATSEGYRIFVA